MVSGGKVKQVERLASMTSGSYKALWTVPLRYRTPGSLSTWSVTLSGSFIGRPRATGS
jgi:hypothetical protein